MDIPHYVQPDLGQTDYIKPDFRKTSVDSTENYHLSCLLSQLIVVIFSTLTLGY